MIGNRQNYFISDDYTTRPDNAAFDDTPFTDEFQKEVYRFAAEVAGDNALRSVLDIGCGSAYKLVTNFPSDQFATVGIEVADTVEWLKVKYPERSWMVSDFEARLTGIDLVICADVVEHLQDPDSLLRFIGRVAPRWVVISTPDRDIIGPRYGTFYGPPKNIHHVREWNMPEFRMYVGSFFDVASHLNVNEELGTQLILCCPRRGGWTALRQFSRRGRSRVDSGS